MKALKVPLRRGWIAWAICVGMSWLLPAAGCDDGAPGGSANENGPDARPPEDSGPEPGVDAGDAGAPVDPLAAIAKSFRQQMQAAGARGGALAVVQWGDVTLTTVYGQHHPTLVGRVTPDTIFKVGNLSHLLTSVALLQLVNQSLLYLDDPISEHLPDLYLGQDPAAARNIRMWQLLTHTSGLRELEILTVDKNYQSGDALRDWIYDVLAKKTRLLIEPGTFWNHTDAGYVIAGLIVEKVAGEPFAEYIDNHVLLPLGMNRTFFEPLDVFLAGDFATGAEVRSGEIYPPNSSYAPPIWPASGAFTTAKDLTKLIRFLGGHGEKVLPYPWPKVLMAQLVPTGYLNGTQGYGFGLYSQDGIFLDPVEEIYQEVATVSTSWSVPGFTGALYYMPGCDMGLAYLTNTVPAEAHRTWLLAARTLCNLGPKEPWPGLYGEAADRPDYVGLYSEPFFFGDINILLKETPTGMKLLIDIPALNPQTYDPRLRSDQKDQFWVKTTFAGWLELFFVRNKEGKVTHLRNPYFVATRK